MPPIIRAVFTAPWPSKLASGLVLFFATAVASAQNRPMGTDVSSYQGGSLNWTTLRADGLSFAWAKCAEGTATDGYIGPDVDFVANETHAKAAGVYIGAYYFAHPEVDKGATGADAEAAYFWGLASPYIANGGSYLMPMLDVENSYSNSTYMSDWVNEWCQDIVNYAAAKGVVVKPVLYTSPSFASANYNGTVTQWIPWIAEYPFCTTVGANTYCGSPTPQTSAPSPVSPWNTWNLWQYGDTNWSGGDSDVFNGTTNEFLQLFVIGNSNPTLYWDPSAAQASPGSGGSGTWNTTTANWWVGGSTDTVFATDMNAAVFAGTAGTVTLGASLSVDSVAFNTSGYAIAGTATLSLVGPGSVTVPIGSTAAIQCILGGVGLNLSGGGTLKLSNAGNYNESETVVGPNTTLEVSTDHDSGNSGVALNLNHGGIYQDDDATANDQFVLPGCGVWLGTGGGIFKNPNGSLNMTNRIAGSGTLTYAGTTLTLTVNNALNAYTGGTIIQSGTLKANVAGSLGATVGALTVNGGTLNLNSASHTVGTVTIAGGTITTGTLTGASYAGQSGMVTVVLAGNGALTKSTVGTLTLTAANIYTGLTTINAGTLALASSGSINNTPTIGIAAGGTFDVSAITAFVLSTNTSLSASGNVTLATIKGGTTVSLGSRPIALGYDGSHPALTISQGTLVLNGNLITVNGSKLPVGSYVIIQQTSGNISSTNNITVAGTAIGAAGTVASISVNGGQVLLNVNYSTTVALNALSSTPYGNLVTFTATVSPAPSGGTVQFFDNGLPLADPVTVTGATASLSTNGLPVGNHPITAVYSGAGFYLGSSTASPSVQQITLPPNTIPVTIGGVARQGDGSVQLNFSGTPGYVYLIEATSDLTPPIPWLVVSTNAADASGNFSFVDTNAGSYPTRFYQTTIQQ